jgi:hypothetical protein
MMKNMMTILLGVAFLAGCQKPAMETSILAPATPDARAERIETPKELPSSDLLGLSEVEVAKKHGGKTLKREPGHSNKKWFSGGLVHFPRIPGDSYVIERCHVLTFEDGKVVKHELVDRRTAHVSIRPREE